MLFSLVLGISIISLMKIIHLSIAGFAFAIKFVEDKRFNREEYLYYFINRYFKGFIIKLKTGQKIDFTIILEPRLASEVIVRGGDKGVQQTFLLLFEESNKRKIKSFLDIGVLQLQLILRKALQVLLAEGNGFVLHGSAVGMGNKAIMFTGKSGAGKSTIAAKLRKIAITLADDMVIIRKIRNKWFLFQTPFFEKSYWFARSKTPYDLKYLFFVRQSQKYVINLREKNSEVLQSLMGQLFTEAQDQNSQLKALREFINSQIKIGDVHTGLNEKKVVELITSYANQA